MTDGQILVIGASNIDISATSTQALLMGDSNPGIVQTSLGGVGRNIAENLARLGQNTGLLTAYGNDSLSALLRQNAQDIGLDISNSLCAQDAPSSYYICINQPDGDIAVAVSQMDVCDLLTPAYMDANLSAINRARYIVLDANIPTDTMLYLSTHPHPPLFADTVSVTKAEKLRPILGRLTGLKTNRSEGALLSGLALETKDDAILASQAFHRMGIQYVWITLGPEGALVSDGKNIHTLSPMLQTTVNTTGCGDAFFAGALYSLLNGGNTMSMLQNGLAMAGICAASPSAVSPSTSPQYLKQYLLQHDQKVV